MKTILTRTVKAFLIALAFFVLAACVMAAEFFYDVAPLTPSRSKTDITLPELSGTYPVGRRFFDWIDVARPDPFRKSSRRELVVTFWYPAQGIDPPQTGVYLPGSRGMRTARFQSLMMRVRIQSFWSALLRNPLPTQVFAGIKTRAIENAALSGEKPSFPVLIFSPGFSAAPTEYTALLEDVASHGYVVMAIHPTGFIPVTVFEDGRSVYARFWNSSFYNLQKAYPVWVQDILSALNEALRQNEDSTSPLFGRLDMERIGVFGHSFGGAAAAGACNLDSRIRAGLNLDGAPQGDASTWKLFQPFMIVQSDGRAFEHSAWDYFYKNLSVGYRLVIKGSTHHAFTDEAILPLPDNRRKRALVGTVPGTRMLRMTSALVSAFFGVYLQNKSPALLNEVAAQFPEISLERSMIHKSANHAH